MCVYISCFLQQNLRQLRLNLQRLGVDLQSGERACCRNTGGERLRHALTAADETLAKQVESSNVQCAICTFSFTCKLRFSLNYLTGCSALCSATAEKVLNTFCKLHVKFPSVQSLKALFPPS